MKTSVVNSSKIDLGDRIDAEYFEPSYLDNENRLKKLGAKSLSEYCRLVSSAFYPSATELYATGEMPFIRCVDCIDYPTITSQQNDTFERLPLSFIKENKTVKVLKNEDIVITKVGSPCYASIIYGIEEVALSRTVLGVYKIKNIDPFYLTVFLRSKYGFEQLIRERELTIQYQLTLERVGRILAYKPKNENTEKLFRDLFIKSQHLNQESTEEYKKAEALLLEELGLLNWKPRHRLSFVKNFSDTQASERIDAEYFQPMYEDVVERIRQYKNGYKSLSEIVKVKDKNFQPKDDVAYRYIELANISTNGNINGFIEAVGKELPTRARRKVNSGDVIVSTIEGALSSIALINDDLDNALCSTGFFVINSEKINSETLLVLLKSIVGQLQLKKGCSGTILTAIGDEEFKRIMLPDLPASIQSDIKKKITEMYTAKALSKRLLDIAKRGVELAIEKDEQDAEKWIDKEISKLNIKLD